MRSVSLTVCFLFATTLAFAETSSASEKELKKLQGDWTAEVETENGKTEATLTVKNNTLRFDGPEGREWYEGTFEIDASAKPKRITVLIEDCPIEQFKKQTVEGIYSLEDDTWTVCATAPGAPEGPSGFDDEKAKTLEFKRD